MRSPLIKIFVLIGVILAIFGAILLAKQMFWVSVLLNQKDNRSTALVFDKKKIESDINWRLMPRIKGIWVRDSSGVAKKIYPKIISVFLTDKRRTEHGEMLYGKRIYGSAISMENEQVAILYLWVDDEVYRDKDPVILIEKYLYQNIMDYEADAKNI